MFLTHTHCGCRLKTWAVYVTGGSQTFWFLCPIYSINNVSDYFWRKQGEKAY